MSPASTLGNVDHAADIATSTVVASTAVMLLTSASCEPYWGLSFTVCRLRRTASASSGSPLWNEMPERTTMVHTVASALGSIDSAR